MIDYRSRWQSRRQRKARLRRAIITGAVVVIAGIAVLLSTCGRGKVVWTYRPLSEGVPRFTISDGKLFAAWSQGLVCALDATTGAEAGLIDYQRPFGFGGAPVVDGDMLVIGSNDLQIHALSTVSGEVCWKYETRGAVQAQPVIDRQQVIVGSGDGYLYCLELASGVVVWRTDCGGAIGAAAAVAGDVVVVGTVKGRLVGVDRGSGRRLWTLPTAAAVLGPALALDEQIVTAGCDDGRQYIVKVNDYESGAKVELEGLLRLSPVADRQRLYLTDSNGKVVAVALPGRGLLWERNLGQVLTAGLAADGKYLYVGTLAGQIFALRRASGKVRCRWKVGQPVTGSLATSGGLLMAGLGDGRIIALPVPP